MKKWICAALTALLIIGLMGCGGSAVKEVTASNLAEGLNPALKAYVGDWWGAVDIHTERTGSLELGYEIYKSGELVKSESGLGMYLEKGFDGTVAVFLWKEQNGYQAQVIMADGGTTAQQILELPAPGAMGMAYGSYSETDGETDLSRGVPFFHMVTVSDSTKGLSAYGGDMKRTASQPNADWGVVFTVTLKDE